MIETILLTDSRTIHPKVHSRRTYGRRWL